MHCIDRRKARSRGVRSAIALGVVALVAVLAAACGSVPAEAPREPAPPPASGPTAALARGGSTARLPLPGTARSWNDLRLQAARRLVAANPSITYDGAPPDPLLAIPVLEIELNADGSVRHIDVMRVPRQAKDTVQIAIEAVRRAAPFGDVSRLPRPWKFTETFLFNDDRKFKPRTLDF